MSIATVKQDYLDELKVIQAWIERLEIFDEVTEVPPESKMSESYKEGWRHYLLQVRAIGEKMLNLCSAAEASGDVEELKGILAKEAKSYDKVAIAAQQEGLGELVTMLEHEAESRREISKQLS